MTTTREPSVEDMLTAVHCASADEIRQRLGAMNDPAASFFADYLADEFGGWGDLASITIVSGFLGRSGEYERTLDPRAPMAFATYDMLRPVLIAKVAADEEGAATLRRALAFTLAQG
jgi:hypothetical protein